MEVFPDDVRGFGCWLDSDHVLEKQVVVVLDVLIRLNRPRFLSSFVAFLLLKRDERGDRVLQLISLCS